MQTQKHIQTQKFNDQIPANPESSRHLLTIVYNRVLVVKVVASARPSWFAAHKKFVVIAAVHSICSPQGVLP
ncbi:hypothetical protein H5410_048356 [Solanum commersonii]|uniref:Uncharacterized protein n=1 Tax=Solanum commersonii TaxID=4109 RepID=A0A9J5XJM0_SOLCO|nr:hypothetical protein H5410_048356 [Solanum commersonii]